MPSAPDTVVDSQPGRDGLRQPGQFYFHSQATNPGIGCAGKLTKVSGSTAQSSHLTPLPISLYPCKENELGSELRVWAMNLCLLVIN